MTKYIDFYFDFISQYINKPNGPIKYVKIKGTDKRILLIENF